MNLNEDVDDKLKSALFAYFDFYTKDANIYFNPETKSIWMIFPDEKKWVFELKKGGTLWYSYHFFNGIFKYLSLPVDKHQKYITKWVEDTLKNGVNYNKISVQDRVFGVEDTLKNGVNHTDRTPFHLIDDVKDTLKKGKKLNSDESE